MQAAPTPTTNDRTQLSLPSDREIVITREFAAPRARVFDAWTKRDQLMRWYGCAEMIVASCEMDVREGGTYRIVTRMPDGSEHAHSGVYKTVDRPARLVFVERYEPVPGSDHEVALSFTEAGGVTTMTMRRTYPTAAGRDGHLASGMARGLEATFARLEAAATA
jgi:uncharacterized protein YndB with AHSA1/START domain